MLLDAQASQLVRCSLCSPGVWVLSLLLLVALGWIWQTDIAQVLSLPAVAAYPLV